jgi:hypothetical protein
MKEACSIREIIVRDLFAVAESFTGPVLGSILVARYRGRSSYESQRISISARTMFWRKSSASLILVFARVRDAESMEHKYAIGSSCKIAYGMNGNPPIETAG